ncbi:Histone deacetylase hda1 [Orobanche minor]
MKNPCCKANAGIMNGFIENNSVYFNKHTPESAYAAVESVLEENGGSISFMKNPCCKANAGIMNGFIENNSVYFNKHTPESAYAAVESVLESFGDPLRQCYLTPSGYSRLTKSLMDIGCRILLVLEGGYNKATSHGLVTCVETLLENRVISPMETAIETIKKVRELLAPHWPCLVRKADTTENWSKALHNSKASSQDTRATRTGASIIERQAMKILEMQEKAADQASTTERQAVELQELHEHATYQISTIETQAVKLHELQEQASDQASIIERQTVKLQEVQEQSVDQASTIEWQAVKLQEQATTLQSIKDHLK